VRAWGRDRVGSNVEKPGCGHRENSVLLPGSHPRCPGSGVRRILVKNIVMEAPEPVLPISDTVTCSRLLTVTPQLEQNRLHDSCVPHQTEDPKEESIQDNRGQE
jgi:hypothetical protein